jgi:hypothetical protein
MKKNILFIPVLLAFGFIGQAQPSVQGFINNVPLTGETFTDCAAIIYKGEMLVDEYSPRGECKLNEGMRGVITVSAVELNEEGGRPVKNIPFKIAIKNGKTNTQWMFSDKTFNKVFLEDILKECNTGDKIIIITTDQKYALPHNEIEILDGC